MKKFVGFLCIVLPVILVMVLSASAITEAVADNEDIMPVSTIISSLYDDQIVFGTADTGASTAALAYKSGAIFVEPYGEMSIEGGVISGHSNTYGGAIYVSNGATLTISGGSIENNKADYGGAIYVEAGGNLILNAGTKIVKNSASNGPAVYIEEGGNLQTSNDITIENNTLDYKLNISSTKKTVGGTIYDNNGGSYSSSSKLYTVNFGSYPSSYVEEPLSTELESLYARAAADVTYRVYAGKYSSSTGSVTTINNDWKGYKHTDGNIYVRGTQSIQTDAKYHHGDIPAQANATAWFKVEPIEWYVVNYDEWTSGREHVKLLSKYAISAISTYSDSTFSSGSFSWENNPRIRSWCNSAFYPVAFSDFEKSLIDQSSVKNNAPTGSMNYNDIGEVAGIFDDLDSLATQDYVYLPSISEMCNDIFSTTTAIDQYAPERICQATDFCYANDMTVSLGYTHAQVASCKFEDGTLDYCALYWLRSKASTNDYWPCCVMGNGTLTCNLAAMLPGFGVRPMIQLSVAYK